MKVNLSQLYNRVPKASLFGGLLIFLVSLILVVMTITLTKPTSQKSTYQDYKKNAFIKLYIAPSVLGVVCTLLSYALLNYFI